MNASRTWLFVVLAGLAANAALAEPYVEQAQADITPWSGYWWPLSDGGLVRPLGKYDAATGQAAVAWEQANRPMGSGVPGWFGFCHAWAASSIMEPEPRQARTSRAADRAAVPLTVGDQKGMLAACHTEDVANSYGQRFEEGDSEEDRQDLAPDALWRILKLYLGQQQVPVVLDLDAGAQVWNFPAYAYELRSDGAGDGPRAAVLTVWLVDDGVPPDHVGSQVRRLTYTFSYTMRSGAVVLGSGRWTGRSRQDHPDFVWYPYLARAQNPEVQQAVVRQLLGQDGFAVAARLEEGRGFQGGGRLGGNPLEDVVLAVAVLDQQPAALLRFAERFRSRAIGLAVKTNPRAREDAEDWWCQLLVHLIGVGDRPGKLRTYAGRCGLWNWLARVVRNFPCSADWGHDPAGDSADIDHLAAPPRNLAEDRDCQEVLGGAIRHALAQLAPEWRALLYLLFAERLPGQDVAAALGVHPAISADRRSGPSSNSARFSRRWTYLPSRAEDTASAWKS